MTYGLYMEGNGGIFQIDSSVTNTRWAGLKATGGIAADTFMTTAQMNTANGDLLFARPTSTTSSSSFTSANYVAITGNNGGLVKFLSGVTFATLQTTGGAVATSGGSANVNGSDYGVLVQEADGTVVYDSRKFTTGFELITIYDAGAFTGGSREHYAAGGGTFATYQAGNTIYTATGSTNAEKAADLSSVYVSAYNSWAIPNVNGTAWFANSFYYDYYYYKIYFVGFFEGISTMGVPFSVMKNTTNIALGRIK